MQGGRLTIEYDPERLPVCRGIRLGVPSWDIPGFVHFYPGEQRHGGSLVRRVDGKLIEPVQPMPLTVLVPVDANHVEVWFENRDARVCITWDSRFGQNSWYDVV